MNVYEYGANTLSYKVIRLDNNRIELQVYNHHQGMRNILQHHQHDPQYFWQNLQSFAEPDTRARYWLARVVVDFPYHFRYGLVDITFKS